MQEAIIQHRGVTDQPTFRGQQADEDAVLVARGHWLVLLAGGWPVIIGVLVLALLLGGQMTSHVAQPAWSTGEMLVGVVTLSLLARWAITEAYPWWFRLFIITNRRLIVSQGGISSQMEEIALHKIQAVTVESKTVLEWLCGFGRVTVAAASGTPLTFTAIATPQQVASLIMQTRDQHALVTTAPMPRVNDPQIQELIDRLGTPIPEPTGDGLAFGASRAWPLSRAANMNNHRLPLAADETLLGVVSRHWWALVRPSLPALVLLSVGAGLLGSGFWFKQSPAQIVALAVLIVGIIWFLAVYLNFADDVFIFTTRRIIDVERKYFVLFQIATAIEYGNIQEVNVVIPTIWARMLSYGTVQLTVAGGSKVMLDMIPGPRGIESAIERNRVALAAGADITVANRERYDMKEWFSLVLAEVIITTPDLRGMTLEMALETALHVGMHPTVLGESYVVMGTPAGIVLNQRPMPGSRALRGGDISLILSRIT